MSLLLILNRFHTLFWCFQYWLLSCKCQLGSGWQFIKVVTFLSLIAWPKYVIAKTDALRQSCSQKFMIFRSSATTYVLPAIYIYIYQRSPLQNQKRENPIGSRFVLDISLTKVNLWHETMIQKYNLSFANLYSKLVLMILQTLNMVFGDLSNFMWSLGWTQDKTRTLELVIYTENTYFNTFLLQTFFKNFYGMFQPLHTRSSASLYWWYETIICGMKLRYGIADSIITWSYRVTLFM